MYTMPIESEMEVFARVYSQNTGIEIVPGPAFASDGKRIYVVPAMDQMDPWIRFETEVIVYHETGHVKFTNFKLLPKDRILHQIHNSIEDAWIEHRMEGEWKGMAKKWKEFLAKFVKSSKAKINNGIGPAEWILSLLYFRTREQHLGIDFGVQVPSGVQKIWDARFSKYLPEVVKCTSTKQALAIAKRVYADLKDLAQNPPQMPQQSQGGKPQQSQGQGGDQGDQQDGQKGQQNSQQCDQKGDQQDGQDGQDSQQAGGNRKGAKKNSADNSNVDNDPLQDGDAQDALKELKDQVDNDSTDDVDIGQEIKKHLNDYVESNQIIREVTGLKENVTRPYLHNPETTVAIAEARGRKITAVNAARFRNLFISERAPRWQENLESGKINTRKLYRLKTGSVHVFHRKTEGVYEDSAVSLVLDLSNSMNSAKINMARAVLMAMAEMLDRLRVPFEVLGFNTSEDNSSEIRTVPSDIYEIKRFNDSYHRVIQNFAVGCSRYTNEWPAIRMAAYHLAERRETKKVLFILTDGHTLYGGNKKNSDTRYTIKRFIERLKKAGMKVVGLGIQDGSAKYYCPDFVQVNNLDQFAGEMYGKIAKYLL